MNVWQRIKNLFGIKDNVWVEVKLPKRKNKIFDRSEEEE